MKVMSFNDRTGELEVVPETEDDLWILHTIIKKGDIVAARTVRDVGREEGDSRRVSMIVVLQVEKTEFQKFTTRLRIHGIIIDAPERYGIKGSHHTINLDLGNSIAIRKEWNRGEMEKIMRASQYRPATLIALVDYDEYVIAQPMEQGIKILAEGAMRQPSKYEPDRVEENLSEVSSLIQSYVDSLKPNYLILAGPGSFKEKVRQRIRGVSVITDSVSSATRSGLYELMNRDVMREVMRQSNLLEATKELARALELIARGSPNITYGKEEIKRASEVGAVDTLLVTEDILSEPSLRGEVDEITMTVDKKGGKVIVVTTDTPGYYQVRSFGGMLAILRFNPW